MPTIICGYEKSSARLEQNETLDMCIQLRETLKWQLMKQEVKKKQYHMVIQKQTCVLNVLKKQFQNYVKKKSCKDFVSN